MNLVKCFAYRNFFQLEQCTDERTIEDFTWYADSKEALLTLLMQKHPFKSVYDMEDVPDEIYETSISTNFDDVVSNDEVDGGYFVTPSLFQTADKNVYWSLDYKTKEWTKDRWYRK